MSVPPTPVASPAEPRRWWSGPDRPGSVSTWTDVLIDARVQGASGDFPGTWERTDQIPAPEPGWALDYGALGDGMTLLRFTAEDGFRITIAVEILSRVGRAFARPGGSLFPSLAGLFARAWSPPTRLARSARVEGSMAALRAAVIDPGRWFGTPSGAAALCDLGAIRRLLAWAPIGVASDAVALEREQAGLSPALFGAWSASVPEAEILTWAQILGPLNHGAAKEWRKHGFTTDLASEWVDALATDSSWEVHIPGLCGAWARCRKAGLTAAEVAEACRAMSQGAHSDDLDWYGNTAHRIPDWAPIPAARRVPYIRAHISASEALTMEQDRPPTVETLRFLAGLHGGGPSGDTQPH